MNLKAKKQNDATRYAGGVVGVILALLVIGSIYSMNTSGQLSGTAIVIALALAVVIVGAGLITSSGRADRSAPDRDATAHDR